MRKAIDLQEDDPGLADDAGVYLPPMPTEDEPLPGDRVLVGDDRQQYRQDDGLDEPEEDGPAEVVHVEVRADRRDDLHDQAVCDHGEQSAGPHGQLEEEAHEEGPHHDHGDEHGNGYGYGSPYALEL